MANERLFDKCGGYRRLHTFTYATIIHLETISFCKRFIPWQQDQLGKTAGQMIGAARSGRKNIIEAFLEQGGFRERMYKTRSAVREENTAPDKNAPACPERGKPMRKRSAKQGKHAGLQFWGCSGYPECKGIKDIKLLKS